MQRPCRCWWWTLGDCELLMLDVRRFMDQHKSIYSHLQDLCLDKSPPGTVKGLHQMSEIWDESFKSVRVRCCTRVSVRSAYFCGTSCRLAPDVSPVCDLQAFYLLQTRTLHYGFSQVLLTDNLLEPRLSARFGPSSWALLLKEKEWEDNALKMSNCCFFLHDHLRSSRSGPPDYQLVASHREEVRSYLSCVLFWQRCCFWCKDESQVCEKSCKEITLS